MVKEIKVEGIKTLDRISGKSLREMTQLGDVTFFPHLPPLCCLERGCWAGALAAVLSHVSILEIKL